MPRVPYVDREQLNAEGQEIYDRIRRDRDMAHVPLQFRTLLHSPQAASHLTSVGAQLRFHSAIPDNLKEVAILVAAREWNSDIEWTAHVPLAAQAGVSTDSIEAIRTKKAPSGMTDREQVIVRFMHQLLRDKTLSDENFDAAHKLLGTKGIVDLVLTSGYYSAINLAQLALQPELEPGKVSTL